MVQEATSPTTEEASPETGGDEPLVTREDIQQSYVTDIAPTGEEQVVDAAEVPAEDEGARTDQAGDVSTAEEGAAEEQAAEETTEEAPETERTYSQEEWSQRESAKDREVAGIRSELDSLRQQTEVLSQQNQTLQAQRTQDALNAEAQAVTAVIAQRLMEQGIGDAEAQQFSQSYTNLATQAYQSQQRVQELEAQLADAQAQSNRTASSTLATRLAAEHGIPEEGMKYLVKAENPQEMEATAQELGALYRRINAQRVEREAEVSPNGPEQQVDSQTGTDLTDSQKIAAYNAGTFTDAAEIDRILARQGFQFR